MRVSIKHDTMTKGLIFKKTFYRVTMDCTLSEEEVRIIKEANLDRVVIMKRGTPADRKGESFGNDDIYDINFYSIRTPGPIVHTFESPGQARRYAEELEEQMKQAKEYLEQNDPTVKGEDTSFEL